MRKSMENKKVLNANPTLYNNILFKSKLETTIYKVFQEKGVKNLQYEKYKFIIWEGFKPSLPFYIRSKDRHLTNSSTKLINITYTPDLTFEYGEYLILVEVKPGYCNDVYPYKRKLFRKFLEDSWTDTLKPFYCQLGSKKEALELLEILDTNYKTSIK